MISDLNKIAEKVKDIKAFVLDMDGTIYLGKELFPYTHKFLDKVTATDRRYYFFTNNSSRSLNDYVVKLHNMGIEITPNQMMISTQVILEFLNTHHKHETVYVVGTPALVNEFVQDGWTINDVNPDLVILGFDTTLNYDKLSKACTFIRNGATYYGINPDLNCPMENNVFIPDCGSIAKLIEASTKRYPEFFGKPSKRTLDYIIKTTGLKPEQIAIIGDRIYTDIAVAAHSKVCSILVMSGETTKKILDNSQIKPDIIIQDIGLLADLL